MPSVDDRPGDLCLERLLAEARHAGGRAEPARRHPDGLPLHLRIRAARPARRSDAASSASEIDLADFDPNQLESGKVDGKLYGISMGANSMTHVYKPAHAGAARPDAARSDQVDDRRLRRHGQGGEGQAAGGRLFLARTWPIASRGSRPGCASAARRSTPPTASSATTSRTSTDYFAFWFQMQEDGLTPPADLQAQAIANRQDGRDDDRHRARAVRLHPLQPARGRAEAGAGRAEHHHDPEPEGRQAGPVPEAVDADLDGGDGAPIRKRRRS